jgi:hypothetical protein
MTSYYQLKTWEQQCANPQSWKIWNDEKMLSHNRSIVYRGGLSHMWFAVLKSVSFRILQSSIRAAMFNFTTIFCHNKVWVSPLLLPRLQL